MKVNDRCHITDSTDPMALTLALAEAGFEVSYTTELDEPIVVITHGVSKGRCIFQRNRWSPARAIAMALNNLRLELEATGQPTHDFNRIAL